MYNYKITAQVKRKKKAGEGALKAVMVIFGVLFVLMGIMLSRGFMLPGFLLVGLYFFYDVFSQKEYEYTLEGANSTVAVITGKRYRREAHMLNLQEMEAVAPNWHEKVAKYRIKGGSERLKKYDYTSYDDNIPYYTMIITEEGRKIKLLLDLNDEILRAMKKICPDKVYFA